MTELSISLTPNNELGVQLRIQDGGAHESKMVLSARTSLVSRENQETWDGVHRPQIPERGTRLNAGAWDEGNFQPEAKLCDPSYICLI